MQFVQQESLTIQDFDLLKVIGKGSFGKVSRSFHRLFEDGLADKLGGQVMQVRKKDTSRI